MDSAFSTRVFEIGEDLFNEGEIATVIYRLRSGVVKVTTQQPRLRGRMGTNQFINRILGAGEFLGSTAALCGHAHPHGAQALTPTEVEVFPVETLRHIMNGPPTLLSLLLHNLARDFESQQREQASQYLASVQERISHQLLQLGDRFGQPDEEGIRLGLRLSRNELAQLAGTINESLSRHLTDLKEEGILGLRGKEIVIKNRAALLAKAGQLG